MNDTEYSENPFEAGGWKAVAARRTIRRQPTLRVRDLADDSESEGDAEVEDYSWADLPRRTSFPPVAEMIKFSYTEPAKPRPLDPSVFEQHSLALRDISSATKDLQAAEAKLRETNKEISALKNSISSLNKWSSTAKTAAPTLQRLTNQQVIEAADVEKLKKKLEAVKSSRRTVIELVGAYNASVSTWESYQEMVKRHAEERAADEKKMVRDLSAALQRAKDEVAGRPSACSPLPWKSAVAATALY